jgi:RNA polymerase sigma factor (sigma-70 family)
MAAGGNYKEVTNLSAFGAALMSHSALAAGLRHLRGVVASQQHRDDSDEQLLHAFAAGHDETAFATLVRRHGPMVLHVCRRVLGQQQDAEDAFQATFLVLARNAGSLRKKSAVAGFLHGTAYRLALHAKRAAARRRKHEKSLGALTQPRSPADPAEELSWREMRVLLDEEIARLPEKYRSVFVLCCLENLSRAEAG